MAIIYNYPLNSILLAEDMLIGTSTKIVNGQPKNATKNFSIADLTGFIKQNVSLDDVLLVGNTSLLDAKIGGLYLYDTPVADYGNIALNQNRFSFTTVTHGEVFRAQRDMFSSFSSSGYRGSFEVSSITANRVWSFPDQTGTVALLSDIPVVVTPTLQSVTTAGNTTTLDIYANSFYTNTGYALMDDGTAIVDNVQFGSTLSYIDYNGTGSNVWQLPDQAGTIALTSDIPTYTIPTLQQVVTQGNSISDNTIDFYELGNNIGSIGGSYTFLFFNNQGSGGNKYSLDAFGGFSISNQDDTQYSVLDPSNLSFYETSKNAYFNVNGFFKGDLVNFKNLSINFPATIVGTNKTQTFQDADGTIALLSDIPAGGVTSVTATSPITSSGGATPDISTSMATNKLIGRSTAGVGVMEEITIGTGLTLSGGILNGSATGVTSVGLTMPSAFTVTNSPITSSGDIAVTGAGLVSQYVRGDGTLANFPNSTGGGSSVNYYLNGSVSQGTFGGDTYYQMSKTPILGGGTNFIRTNGAGDGYIASFITDAGDPSFLNIPGGNWNLEFYFQSSATGGSPQFYAELYKVSATNVFTLVASGSTNPEGITNGTTVDQYFTSIPVPQTTLLVTDRLAVRIYVITSGRTITLHTENGNLCEVLTTFTTGLTALNGLTDQVQFFDVGTGATNFNISSSGDTHTFNLLFNIRRNANNSSNNNINYNGYAVTGSAESSAVWTITRLTISASGSITVATATNVAWTDRETTIYT